MTCWFVEMYIKFISHYKYSWEWTLHIYDFIQNTNHIGLHSDAYEQIYLKLYVMINITKLYSFISFWII